MVFVPLDGESDSVFEHCRRGPAEFCHGFGGVNGVALVVAFAVGHVGDQALGFSEFCQDDLYDFDIGFLVVAAEVVDFSDFAFFQYGEDAVAVVFDVKPVADVEALSVDGEGFVLGGVVDHEWDEFFGELVGSIVVGAAADGDGQSVCSMVGLDEKVCGCLGCAVG